MFSSQRYFLYSLIAHALVLAAAVMLSSVVESRGLQVHPIEVEEPAAEEPDLTDPPPEDVDVEETTEDVELVDVHVIEIEPAERSGPEPRRSWTPGPRPKQWLTRVAPATPEEEPVQAVAKPSTAPPPVRRPPPLPPPAVEVIKGQNPSPPYPALAQRRGWEGDVLIDVTVDFEGKVLACAVASSSGFSLLDSAAATAVRDWRFRNGPGSTRVRVSFLLGRL